MTMIIFSSFTVMTLLYLNLFDMNNHTFFAMASGFILILIIFFIPPFSTLMILLASVVSTGFTISILSYFISIQKAIFIVLYVHILLLLYIFEILDIFNALLLSALTISGYFLLF